MEEFLHWLQGTMARPTWFGWFHILWICIMIAECVVVYIFRKKISKKALNIILLSVGIALIIFEIYKQIINSFNYNGGGGRKFVMVISVVCLSIPILFNTNVFNVDSRNYTQGESL